MKKTLTKISSLALACLLVAEIGKGQTAELGSFNNNLTPIQSSSADSIVQLTAEAQGLALVPPEQVPFYGTFWMVTSGSLGVAVPLPCPPLDPTLPVFQISDGIFLVDGTVGSPVVVSTPRMRRLAMASNTGATVEAALAAQADAIVNLITQIQTASANQPARMLARSMAAGIPSPGDGLGDGSGNTNEDFANNEVAYAFDTNQLWLEITNVSNGWSYLTLHNSTNKIYAIWGTTNLALPFASWNVETEVWPTDINCQPFTVANYGWLNMFLRAEDWTGVDSDSDGIPDWWTWKYFGNVNLTDINLDYSGNGNTFAQDYSNNITPTVFTFTGIEVTNNFVNFTPVLASLDVTGSPYYLAVSVDDTNYATDAVWHTCSSTNVAVNLGLTEGWHDVWIGLRGHGDDPTNAVWQWKRLKLVFTPPVLVLTNPVAATVDQPVIQLQGYSSEALSSIRYDLSNAAGTVTNQQVLVLDQQYDATTCEFTTNTFQGFDILLTNGVNIFTFHATDLAGNVTTLVTNFTLNYLGKTNPPAVQLLWPLDGMEICGSNVVCRGQVADPTASVTVQLVDANGQTITAGSLVGRDGIFYADNLTLATGTNYLSCTVADAAGNVAVTNLTVVTSDLGLTLDPVVAGQAVVTGTIDDDSYTIYVNGVTATNTGNGLWTALITPISGTGGAVVVNAVKAGGDPSLQQVVLPPQGVYMDYSYDNESDSYYWGNKDESEYQQGESDWSDIAGGSAMGQTLIIDYASADSITTGIIWPASPWPAAVPWGILWVTNNGQYHHHTMRPAGLSFYYEHANVKANDATTGSSFTEMVDGVLKFATGGPLGSTARRLYQFSGSVTVHHNPTPDTDEVPWSTQPEDETVADGRVSLGSLGNLDANGKVYALLEDNVRVGLTPTINGADDYSFPQPSQQIITLNSLTVVSNATSIDDTNWAAVKTVTNDWVYVQAGLSASDTNAARYIQWSGGEAVPGGDNTLRRVTKTISAETTVTATLGSTSTNLNVWIIWATVSIQTSGSNPSPLSFTNHSPPLIDILGVVFYDNTNRAVGQMCAVTTATPAGIHKLIQSGWDWVQKRVSHDFNNGTGSSSYYDSTWQPDGPDFVGTNKTVVLDNNDKLYTVDVPNIGSFASDSAEVYGNFYDYVTYGGQTCSDTNNFWHFQGRWKADQTPQVTFTDLGTGTITLPNTPYYSAP